MRFPVTSAISAVGLWFASLFVASSASAEDCPEGDWFCEPSPASEAAPADSAEGPPNAVHAASPPEARHRRRGFHRRERDAGHIRLRTVPPPERQPRRKKREWGFGPHVFGALLGSDEDMSSNAGMGGLGFTLRLRPIPELALDGSLELGFGTDYNGYDRQETAGLFHAVGFLNPRSVVQAYVLGGFGFSTASVSVEDAYTAPIYLVYDEHYSYFGLDLGVGVEFRLNRLTALHLDVVGFVRDRTGRRRNSRPEFVNPRTHQSTDTSGGGLLRAGAIFYWR